MRLVRKALAALAFGMVFASLSLVPATAEESRQPETPIARMNVGPISVDWLPAFSHERLVLTIVGPQGFVDRQELVAGQSPSLSLFKPDGEPLSDGLYRYELWVLPHASQEIIEANAREAVQRGTLWVRDGRFVVPDPPGSRIASPPAQSTPSQIRNITGKDSVIPDDLVVQGTACIGPSCVNGDPDSHILKLKGRAPQIYFDDPLGTGCCYPATDWVLQANTADPVSPDFFLREAFSGNTPFSVRYNAPSYSLVVAGGVVSGVSESRVGIGTQVPLQSLHALSPATPTLRLEKAISPGPARTWDVGANQTSFFVRDVTNSSSVPFQISAGAPSNSLFVASNGRVGIGTATPGAAHLHVFGVATTDVSGGFGPDPASGPAFNFGYAGASFGRGAGFLNARPDASATWPNPSLRFLTANAERMIITSTGNIGIGTSSPGATLHVASGEVRIPGGTDSANGSPTHFRWPLDGKNYIRGTTIIADDGGSVGIGTQAPSSKLHVNGGDIRVSGGSFIDDGVTLNAPDYVFEPSYELMPLDELREFVAQEKHLPNVPNAAEIRKQGLNLGQFQMRLLEKIEELALYTLKQEEDLQSLRDENLELKARLEALENAQAFSKPR